VNIIENPITVEFSSAAYSVNENSGSVPLTVFLSQASSSDVSVLVKTRDGTAIGEGDGNTYWGASPNFKAMNERVTIPAGQNNTTFDIQIYNTLMSGTENFYVDLSEPIGATVYGNSSAMVNITANIENNPMKPAMDNGVVKMSTIFGLAFLLPLILAVFVIIALLKMEVDIKIVVFVGIAIGIISIALVIWAYISGIIYMAI
jgi:hypothetical protein